MKTAISTLASLVAAAALTSCCCDPFSGATPDKGPRLHKDGRPSIWAATRMPLGDTGFQAEAGPSRYQDKDNSDWDYYSIEVQRTRGKIWHLLHCGEFRRADYVFFERDFAMSEIPTNAIRKNITELASFDPTTRVVLFEIGTNRCSCRLPDR